MPFTAQDLIEGRQAPITVQSHESLTNCLQLMIENDYSQLPVVDENNIATGLIDNDSILRRLFTFKASIETLSVKDAGRLRVRTYSKDDDIFDVLNGLQDQPAVLVVDSENKLMGIITSYDTTTYFRLRAEDGMLLEDIEEYVKSHIHAAFTSPDTGEIDDEALRTAIDAIDSSRQLEGKFLGAMQKYFALASIQHKPDRDLIQQASELLSQYPNRRREFDDLTLYEFTELLLHKSRWDTYGENFGLDSSHLRNLLDDVRKIRNKLAHFRGEITNFERHLLRDSLDWFEQNLPVFPDLDVEDDTFEATAQIQTDEIIPVDEELGEKESRYAKLAQYLQGLSRKTDRIRLAFDDIEEILGAELPPSAAKHRHWWANDSVGHVQSRQWLSVDWRVASINLTQSEITFARIKERETLYIDFFSALQARLRETAEFDVHNVSPSGKSWIDILKLPRHHSGTAAIIVAAFTRERRFRVELYIDTGDGDKNFDIFDQLHAQAGEVEHEIGAELSWERLNNKRASRIALYTDGSIVDGGEKLTELVEWATSAAIRFEAAIADRAEHAIEQVIE